MEERDVTRLKLGAREIILIGTAHVSAESVALVARTIAAENPDTVCVELCPPRYEALKNPDKWQETDIVKVIREKKTTVMLSQLIVAAFQKRMASRLEVTLGAEMLKAVELAAATGARLELVDREIRVTILRAWRTLGFWGKVSVLTQAVLAVFSEEEVSAQEIESLKERDILQVALKEIGARYPQLKRTLIDERDVFLAHKIANAPGERVVAVLGAGHIPGVSANIGKDANIADLNTIPPEGVVARYSGWALLGLVGGFFLGGFFLGGTQVGLAMLGWWALITAACATVGAVVMFSHPMTILATALAAPLATLHPFVATGWVAGLVEATLRKPQVRDFIEMKTDIVSMKGFFKNKVTRLLVLIAVVNIAASVGTFIALPLVVRLFFRG